MARRDGGKPLVHVNAPGRAHTRTRAIAALLVLVVFPAAAAGYYFGYNTGTLRVYVTDDLIDDFRHLNITFSQVQVKSAGALTISEWVSVDLSTTTVDLTALRDNITAPLGLGKITAGGYSHLRIVVESAVGELNTGENVEVTVPSGELKTNSQFTMKPQGELSLFVRLQVVEAGGTYILRPVIGTITSG